MVVDALLQARIDADDFSYANPTTIAFLATGLTAHWLVKCYTGIDWSAAEGDPLFWRQSVLGFTYRAEAACEPLRTETEQTAGEQVRRNAQIGEAGHRTDRIIGVQRRKH